MAARSCACGPELSRTEGPNTRPEAAHGLRKRGLSECRRMLEPANRDLHDSRQCVHPPLWILCSQKGGPLPVDYDEPRRVAEAVAVLGLRYAVVTSVNRDDERWRSGIVCVYDSRRYGNVYRAARWKFWFRTFKVASGHGTSS